MLGLSVGSGALEECPGLFGFGSDSVRGSRAVLGAGEQGGEGQTGKIPTAFPAVIHIPHSTPHIHQAKLGHEHVHNKHCVQISGRQRNNRTKPISQFRFHPRKSDPSWRRFQ